MSYIRTKDERVIAIDEMKEIIPSLRLTKKRGKIVMYQGSEILKQADTIEELCDEFVYVFENTTNIIFSNYEALKNHSFDPSKTFGAIWTNKGLIYVAKMNDEGELELL